MMKKMSDEEMLKQIGKVISIKRMIKNKSQTAFSQKLKISQSTLSHYERGELDIPILKMKNIAEVYDFEMVDYFITPQDPSNLWQIIIENRKIAKLRRKRKKDKYFDDYILLPENEDKAVALYHASELAQYIPDESKEEYVSIIRNVLLSNITNDTQAKRLKKYMEIMSKNNETDKN